MSDKYKKNIKGLWDKKEDKKLLQLVKKYSTDNWVMISKEMGTRCNKQCRERWYNNLRPDIKKEPLSLWEQRYIIEQQKLLGNKWSVIAKNLPGRSDNTVKNFVNSYLKKKAKSRLLISMIPFYGRKEGNSGKANKLYYNLQPCFFKVTRLSVLADVATNYYYKYKSFYVHAEKEHDHNYVFQK